MLERDAGRARRPAGPSSQARRAACRSVPQRRAACSSNARIGPADAISSWTRPASWTLARLCTPWTSSPSAIAVVHCSVGEVRASRRMRCKGGSRRMVALSTSVSKQNTTQPRSGPGRSGAPARTAATSRSEGLRRFDEAVSKRAALGGLAHRVADHPSVPNSPGIYLFSQDAESGYAGQSHELRQRLRHRYRSTAMRGAAFLREPGWTASLMAPRTTGGVRPLASCCRMATPSRHCAPIRRRGALALVPTTCCASPPPLTNCMPASACPKSRPSRFPQILGCQLVVQLGPAVIQIACRGWGQRPGISAGRVRAQRAVAVFAGPSRQADDGGRTRDLRLGKPTLCQLSYVRAAPDSRRFAGVWERPGARPQTRPGSTSLFVRATGGAAR